MRNLIKRFLPTLAGTEPTTSTLVVDPSTLDEANRERLRAWLGLSPEAMQMVLAEGGTLPLSEPGDSTALTIQANKLSAAGLKVEAEPDSRPFATTAGLSLKLGLLGGLLVALPNILVSGMGPLMGHTPDLFVIVTILLPAVIGTVMAMGALPTALILFILGTLRQHKRRAELAGTTRKLTQLRTEQLPGEAGRLQAYCQDLSRRVVEAGLPPALEADLLSGLSACLSALPDLSSSLAHVESGLEHTHRADLEEAHSRLTSTLQEVAAQVATIEAGLAELSANTWQSRRATGDSTIGSVQKTAQALHGLAREMRTARPITS